MSVLNDTIAKLKELASKRDSILVAFSGGKDSLCCLDLCCAFFPRVEAFYMYLVPGLRHMEERLEYARQRWKIPIRQYPHAAAINGLRAGVFCDPWWDLHDFPPAKLAMVNHIAMQDSGIDLICSGGKDADSLWRKRSIKARNWKEHFYPLKDFSKWDVIAYLTAHKIPRPPDENARANASGADLSASFLCWCYDNFPDDFERIEAVFPYVSCVISRRDMYGVGA